MLLYERLMHVSIGLAAGLLLFAAAEIAAIENYISYVLPTWLYALTAVRFEF
eukprot:SAG31_NODE_693_length_12770_cov_64.934575_2_plen_52_part_00